MPREHKGAHFNNIGSSFSPLKNSTRPCPYILVEQVTRKKCLIHRQSNGRNSSNWRAIDLIYNHVLHLLKGLSTLIVCNQMGMGPKWIASFEIFGNL
jgi:hypothetical protein